VQISITISVVLLLTMSVIGDDVSDFTIPEIPAEPLGQVYLSESQTDKLYATTLFGQARLEQRRRQFANALQLYQRAWRYDRSVVSISNELIPLAMGLKRSEEAARYASLAITEKTLDSQTLMRMAVVLTRNGSYERAVQAYQMILARKDDSSIKLPKALISAELGRTALLAQKNDLAARAFDDANAALQNPDEAGLTPAHITQLKGSTGAIFLAMNEVYQSTKQFAKARNAIEQAQQVAPNAAMYALRLAGLLLAESKPQQALTTLQIYFDSKSLEAKADPYRLLIKINEVQHSDVAEANTRSIEQLLGIQQTQTSNHYIGYTLAELALAAGNADLAIEQLRKHLPIQPILSGYQNAVDAILLQHSNDTPLTESAAMELAWVLGHVYSRSRSLAALQQQRIAKITSDKVLLSRLEEVAFAYVVDDRVPADTKISLKTFTSHTAAAIGLLFSDTKDWQQAEKFFELAIAEAPRQSGAVYQNWGAQLLMNDQRISAIKTLERALNSEFVRNKATIHFLISGAYLLNNQNEKAVNSSKIAAEQANNSPRLLSRYPWILYHTGQLEQAQQEYTQLISKLMNLQTTPGTASTARDARLTLSTICQRLGESDDAVEWLEQVLDTDPEDPGALNDLGYLWAERNEHLLRAEQMTTKAVAADPDNSAYRDSLGWAYYRLGKFTKAKAELEEARKLNDSDGIIYDHLGDTQLQLGDQQQAQKMWQRALELLDAEKDAKQIDLIRKKIEQLR
tara:strand:- start:93 stop:2321 length:2229 start_codon:yes stop_codon:yes gene_type:complete